MNILVLCTGNSARSILGEALIRDLTPFQSESAGSNPVGKVNPAAIRILKHYGHETTSLTSKSWDVFSQQNVSFDCVITVCDNAANESCPVFPGAPIKVHWGLPDPAAVDISRQEKAFDETYHAMRDRVLALKDAYEQGLRDKKLQDRLQEIGHTFIQPEF